MLERRKKYNFSKLSHRYQKKYFLTAFKKMISFIKKLKKFDRIKNKRLLSKSYYCLFQNFNHKKMI